MSERVPRVARRLPERIFAAALALLLIVPAGFAARKPVQSIGGGLHDTGRGAATATIGGSIYTGANDGTGMGGAILHAVDPIATPHILDATVMVEDEEGDFVTYGTMVGSSWTATVPAPGEYLVMISAPNHDATSRRFVVTTPGENLVKDAYLPSLPLPLANLLVFCFEDFYTNGEPDEIDIDPPLDGVTLHLLDEQGNVVQTGVTGTGLDNNGLPTAGRGLFYFTGVPAGEYHVQADPSTVPGRPDWHYTYSEEGGLMWEIPLYPGDPGTEDGGYLIWYGFVENIGQIPNSVISTVPPDAGTISGLLRDADDPALGALEGEPPPSDPCVIANLVVPDGKVILYRDAEAGDQPTPVATTFADPVTGTFEFVNVPPGRYGIFAQDIEIDYVWVPLQVQLGPGENLVDQELWLPRFYARTQGYVLDGTTNPPTPVMGAQVNMRQKSGHVWMKEFTDGTGWYNFDNLPEIEVMAFLDVTPPPGYRMMNVAPDSANPDSCQARLGMQGNRYVQFYTANYHADLYVEPIPPTEGDITGFAWYDELARGTWVGDGVWNPDEEPILEGVPVYLWDATMTTLLDSTVTNVWDPAPVIAQGWVKPFSQIPPDEWGGVFNGPLLGHYEFRGLPPGDYVVQAIPPAGYHAVTPDAVPVTVAGGLSADTGFGFTTLAPRSGFLEGGIWDDLNIDNDPNSLMFMEKAAIVDAPVAIYDHNYYPIDEAAQPAPYLPGSPEIEFHMAPGPHIFIGNDPAHPAFNPNYLPLVLPYTFGQGKAKYEADWSLVPVAFLGLNGAMAADWPILATNRPQLAGPIAQKFLAAGNPKPGATVQILGSTFGDFQGSGTVTLSGVELPVHDWQDGAVTVTLPDKALAGPVLVTTSTGISNALPIEIDYSSDPALEAYILARSRFVDAANAGFEDGSQASPFNTIQEAVDNLPSVTPRYVFVAAGEYTERVVIRESDVEIIGAGPLETTVSGVGLVKASSQGILGAGPTFEIETGLENIRISGFTITGGTSDNRGIGGGIFASAHCRNLEISNNIVVRNGAEYGGGFWTHFSTHDVTIHSNIFAENGNFGGFGGGVSFADQPAEFTPPHAQPEHIWDDYNPGPPPGTIEIYNNQFLHNFSMDYGGGACLYETKDQLVIHGNMFLENSADDHGGALFFEDSGPVDIFNNVFYRNYCPDDGGAISFEDVADTLSHVNIWNNLFTENIADDRGENHARGGALAFDDVRDAMVFNNTIAGNIVCGSYTPAGGALDSERHGHEYSGLGGPFMPPGYSDPQIFNNIIWGNWKMIYDQPVGGEEGDLDYTWGSNYTWSVDEMHVDNPAINNEWDTYLNSESFTVVENNDIRGGYASGVDNVDVDPGFVNPANHNWRLSPGSPVIDQANALVGPTADLEGLLRSIGPNGMIDMGAFEWRPEPGTAMRIPQGVLGAISPPMPPPVPGTVRGSAGVAKDNDRGVAGRVSVRTVDTLRGTVAKESSRQDSRSDR